MEKWQSPWALELCLSNNAQIYFTSVSCEDTFKQVWIGWTSFLNCKHMQKKTRNLQSLCSHCSKSIKKFTLFFQEGIGLMLFEWGIIGIYNNSMHVAVIYLSIFPPLFSVYSKTFGTTSSIQCDSSRHLASSISASCRKRESSSNTSSGEPQPDI